MTILEVGKLPNNWIRHHVDVLMTVESLVAIKLVEKLFQRLFNYIGR